MTVGLLLSPLPPTALGAWQSQMLDLGHVPLFAVLVVLLEMSFGPRLGRILLGAVVFAGVVEIVQPPFGRTGDWGDFVRGVLGSLSGAAVVRAWEHRRSVGVAAVYVILALAMWVWPVADLGPYVLDTVDGFQSFPVLAAFETERELRRWDTNQAELHLTTGAGPRSNAPGARLRFLPGPEIYSYGSLQPVEPDFDHYHWLCCDFRVVDGPVRMDIAVRTRTDDPHQTAHNQVVGTYPTGPHAVRIDLVSLATRARPQLDLSGVRSVSFIAIRTEVEHTIEITRVWLER